MGLQAQTPNPASLKALFAEADRAVWDRLKGRPPRITLPQAPAGQPVQAFDLLTFTLKAGPSIAGTHLFQHGLIYRWMFVPTSEDNQRRAPFPEESREPSVVAYPDAGGRLAVSGVIEHPITGETIDLAPLDVPVVASAEFRRSALFEDVELASFGIAGAIAMASGLWLLYTKNPTFGSLQDYLGLFLWGVGVDQGKNLVQLLKT